MDLSPNQEILRIGLKLCTQDRHPRSKIIISDRMIELHWRLAIFVT